jgi:hypothetical protein
MKKQLLKNIIMNKLTMLAILMLINLTVFSQPGTPTNSEVKCFPISIVKLITKDLIIGDSAKNLLKITERQLLETENKIILKDSVINSYINKENNYKLIINGERTKFETLEDFNKNLQLSLKKSKFKTKLTSTISITIIGILTGLILIK